VLQDIHFYRLASRRGRQKVKALLRVSTELGLNSSMRLLKEHAWLDAGKYVSHASRATGLLQLESDEPFVNQEMEKGYFEVGKRAKENPRFTRLRTLCARKLHGIVSRSWPSNFPTKLRRR